MTPDEAKAAVLQMFPDAQLFPVGRGKMQLIGDGLNGHEPRGLSGWVKTEDDAWIDAAAKWLNVGSRARDDSLKLDPIACAARLQAAMYCIPCKDGPDNGGGFVTSVGDVIRVCEAIVAASRWMDRPSGPGLWVTVGDLPGNRQDVMLACDWTEADLLRGAPFHIKRCYGPIPPDPKAMT